MCYLNTSATTLLTSYLFFWAIDDIHLSRNMLTQSSIKKFDTILRDCVLDLSQKYQIADSNQLWNLTKLCQASLSISKNHGPLNIPCPVYPCSFLLFRPDVCWKRPDLMPLSKSRLNSLYALALHCIRAPHFATCAVRCTVGSHH